VGELGISWIRCEVLFILHLILFPIFVPAVCEPYGKADKQWLASAYPSR